MAAFRELDCLRDRRVGWDASHVQQLVGAEPEQVGHVGVEASQSATDTQHQQGVDPCAAAEHAVHQLLRPSAVAGIETRRAALKRRIE